MKVLVIGSLNMDLVAFVDRMPLEGETILGNELKTFIGGKGANQASAVALQGVDVTMWGFVGEDNFGDHIINNIKDLGIISEVDKVNTSTGTALIEKDAKGLNRIVVIPGANGMFTVEKALDKIHLLDDHDIVVMQFEIPIPTIEYIASESKKRGKIVIINPAPALAISEELMSNIDYIIPNEHELSIITNQPTETLEQIQSAVESLSKKGIPHTITTLGSKGVFVNGYIVDAKNTIPVDTTGAGDAFIGGFTGALAKGLSIDESVKHANKVAAISVSRYGAFGSAGSFEEAKNL